MPNFAVNCPQCSAKLDVPAEMAGDRVRCPKCSETFSVERPHSAAPPARSASRDDDDRDSPSRSSSRSRSGGRRDEEDDDRGRRRRRDEEDDDRGRRRRRDEDDRDDRPSAGNGMAVAGMVMGIVGFVMCFIPCIGWFFALVLGILGAIFSGVGLAAASESREGKGMAITGLVLSILAVLFVPLWWFIVIGSLATAASNMPTPAPPPPRGGFPFPNQPGR